MHAQYPMHIWKENDTYNSRTTHLLTCTSHSNAHTYYSTDMHMGLLLNYDSKA